MEFTQQHQYAFNKYKNGENIFITGPGGSGKSIFIKKLVKYANDYDIEISVCAMTGCAALLLECGAKTIHSWGGFGIAKGKNSEIADNIANNKYKRTNWRKVQILVVDEISMLSYKLFELMELTARKTRKNEKLFGGIQLVFCGDFFQLPPVGDNDDIFTRKFCFESELFDKVFPNENKIQFTKIFRQKDIIYSKILNKLRVGKISQKGIHELNKCIGKTCQNKSLVRPTIIHPLKSNVEQINQKSLHDLPGEISSFNINYELLDIEDIPNNKKQHIFDINKSKIENEYKILENTINCPKSLKLKVGAQVMCTVNIDLDEDKPICNGSQGIISHFHSASGFPVVRFNNGLLKHITPHSWTSENIPIVYITQIPLILAWAVTIHKIQGATIDIAEIDIGSGIFEYGQSYVALSRVTNLEGLFLKSFDPSKIKINSKVQQFYQKIPII